jgi:hypothetical protein
LNFRFELGSCSWKWLAAALLALAAGASPLLGAACDSNVLVGYVIGDSGGAADAPNADVGAEGEAGAGSPVGRVAGLVLWLDGDRDVSRAGGALVWFDQSGHGNDAVAPSSAPPSTTDGFNGHSGIAFDSTQLLTVADNATLQFTADFTVIVVARSKTPPSAYAVLFGKTVRDYPYPGPSLVVNYPPPLLDPPRTGFPTSTAGAQLDFINYIQSEEMGVSDGAARIFEMQRTGTTLSVRVGADKATSATLPMIDAGAAGTNAFIGGHNPYGAVIQGLTGAIAEVLAINGSVSASDDAMLLAYLSNKYAIP